MWEFLNEPTARAVLWVSILLIVMAVGYYIVQFARDRTIAQTPSSNEMLTDFRDMRSQGDLTEEEFRTIKNVLGEKMQDELNNSGDEG